MTDETLPVGDFTGLIERRQTFAHIQSLCGGRVWRGEIPDGTQLPIDAQGRVEPYIIMRFGAPVRSGRDRALAEPEKNQPHVLPLVVSAFAGVATKAEDTIAEVSRQILDYQPCSNSAGWVAKGGYGYTTPSVETRPTRHEEGLFFELDINL